MLSAARSSLDTRQAALSRLLSDYRQTVERDCQVPAANSFKSRSYSTTFIALNVCNLQVLFDTYAGGTISFDDLCTEIVGGCGGV
jgi:hypothetical protein